MKDRNVVSLDFCRSQIEHNIRANTALMKVIFAEFSSVRSKNPFVGDVPDDYPGLADYIDYFVNEATWELLDQTPKAWTLNLAEERIEISKLDLKADDRYSSFNGKIDLKSGQILRGGKSKGSPSIDLESDRVEMVYLETRIWNRFMKWFGEQSVEQLLENQIEFEHAPNQVGAPSKEARVLAIYDKLYPGGHVAVKKQWNPVIDEIEAAGEKTSISSLREYLKNRSSETPRKN